MIEFDNLCDRLKGDLNRLQALSVDLNFDGTTNIYPGTHVEQCVKFEENEVDANLIGSFSYFGRRTMVYHTSKIGRYCSIGQNVLIGATPHPVSWLSSSTFFYRRGMWKDHPIVSEFYEDHSVNFEFPRSRGTIGNDVWIGSHAVLSMGVNVGDGAIIAANSTVTKDVPPYAIVGGSPAKVIRYRFDDDLIAEMLKFRWWDIRPNLLKGLEFSNPRSCLDYIKGLPLNELNCAYKPETCDLGRIYSEIRAAYLRL